MSGIKILSGIIIYLIIASLVLSYCAYEYYDESINSVTPIVTARNYQYEGISPSEDLSEYLSVIFIQDGIWWIDDEKGLYSNSSGKNSLYVNGAKPSEENYYDNYYVINNTNDNEIEIIIWHYYFIAEEKVTIEIEDNKIILKEDYKGILLGNEYETDYFVSNLDKSDFTVQTLFNPVTKELIVYINDEHIFTQNIELEHSVSVCAFGGLITTGYDTCLTYYQSNVGTVHPLTDDLETFEYTSVLINILFWNVAGLPIWVNILFIKLPEFVGLIAAYLVIVRGG